MHGLCADFYTYMYICIHVFSGDVFLSSDNACKPRGSERMALSLLLEHLIPGPVLVRAADSRPRLVRVCRSRHLVGPSLLFPAGVLQRFRWKVDGGMAWSILGCRVRVAINNTELGEL